MATSRQQTTAPSPRVKRTAKPGHSAVRLSDLVGPLPSGIVFVAAAVMLLTASGPGKAWGVAGHKLINGAAADAVPAGPLRTLLQAHRAYLVDHASDPDDWRKLTRSEGSHHYIDIDRYGAPPYLELPRSRFEAERKYGRDVVTANGLLPWSVEDWFVRLVTDMRKNDTSSVVMDAAILGHYAGDAHVPFHAVENFDGQLTGNKGIHARWEAILVEHYVKPADVTPFPVRFIDQPASAVIGWTVEGAALVPDILKADTDAHALHPDYDSDGYRVAFWKAEGPIVKQQLDESATDLASLLVSAWIVAGKPPLDAPVIEISSTADAAHVPRDIIEK